MRLYVLLPIIFSSCMTGTLEPPSPQFPRATMPFSVEGAEYRGTAVVQRKVAQKLAFKIPKSSPYFMLTTCHREIVYDNPPEALNYVYAPTQFLENVSSCAMKFTQIDPTGRTTLGFLDFTAEETLGMRVRCNGESKDREGVDFCQARAGLIQSVTFLDPTSSPRRALGAKGCSEPKASSTGSTYEIEVSPGLCIYSFFQNNKYFRLTTYGYTAL